VNCDEEEPAIATVTVVGETCLGAANDQISLASRALAKIAGAEMLTIEFGGSAASPVFLRARPYVDLGAPLIEAAVLRRFGISDAEPRQAREAS
jgi:hypothetical protein